jgi:hypothetical protein
VISHFDALVDQRASTAALLRAAAALANAPAGLHDGTTGRTARVDTAGRAMPGPGATDAAPGCPRVEIDQGHATSIWLERPGEPGPLDQLILERCAQALRTTLRGVHGPVSDAAAVRIACDSHVTIQERAAALGALRLAGRVTIVATPATSAPSAKRRALIGDTWALLLSDSEPPEAALPAGACAGIAHVHDGDVPTGWLRASQALQLAIDPAAGGPAHVRHEELGAIATVAEAFAPRKAAAAPDVQAIERLRARRPWVPTTLYHVVGQQSMRQAAAALHIHHSTLRQRVDWLEEQLGYSVRNPNGRLRAATAWTLWRASGQGQNPTNEHKAPSHP